MTSQEMAIIIMAIIPSLPFTVLKLQNVEGFIEIVICLITIHLRKNSGISFCGRETILRDTLIQETNFHKFSELEK